MATSKTFTSAIVISSCLLVSSCATFDEKVDLFDGIQKGTNQLCGIIPTISTIANLVSLFYLKALPVNTTFKAAEEICKGYASSPEAVDGTGFVNFQVNDVTIEAYVRKVGE